jgi:hypothetical protein
MSVTTATVSPIAPPAEQFAPGVYVTDGTRLTAGSPPTAAPIQAGQEPAGRRLVHGLKPILLTDPR